jgi:hypothetical protein
MRKWVLWVMTAWTGVALGQGPGTPPGSQAVPQSAQPVRPVGVVTRIQPDSLVLRTDAGPDLAVELSEGTAFLRVPPGSKDLKSATAIAVSDISIGDRVLVRGQVSDDQKSMVAKSVIVMAKTDLEKAHEAERAEWRRRGIGGRVKALDAAAREITISVPTRPPDPANPTQPVTITLAPNAVLLRYARDSVRFADAKPGTLEEIKVGDQVRALGTKSEDGARFTAEKLVSGSFRNLGATVISVDAPNGTVTVKDLASGKPLVVRTNSDSKLHRLPAFVAQMLAGFTSGATPGGQQGGGAGSWRNATGPPPAPSGAQQGGTAGAWRREGQTTTGAPFGQLGGGAGAGRNGGPPDFQEMLDRAPALAVSDLKPGDALMVLSTEGKDPSEVTAIILLAGVEPILAAQPKGSEEMVLGQWNMSGGGEGGPQ